MTYVLKDDKGASGSYSSPDSYLLPGITVYCSMKMMMINDDDDEC
jgi:hypothetical protein